MSEAISALHAATAKVAPPRVLINAANLHVGGGVAVATSVIDALSRHTVPADRVSLLLSSTVHDELVVLGTDLSRFAGWSVFDACGISALWRGLASRLTGHDVVFTVFGPLYARRPDSIQLCGFAQPRVIYPDSPATRALPWHKRIRERVMYYVQELFFRRADSLVVELEHVRDRLAQHPRLRGIPVSVVYNTADRVFYEPSRRTPTKLPPASNGVRRLGIVSRNYPHKNLALLPALKRVASEVHGIDIEFWVTFNDAEWSSVGDEFRSSVSNVGPLRLTQVPGFYAAMDGVLFPSLLECFSATPLEAMLMGRPLFASDLPFIRDCCHEHAVYFDPLDLDSIAAAIASWFVTTPESERDARLDAATRFARSYPDAEARALAYLDLTRSLAARYRSSLDADPAGRTVPQAISRD